MLPLQFGVNGIDRNPRWTGGVHQHRIAPRLDLGADRCFVMERKVPLRCVLRGRIESFVTQSAPTNPNGLFPVAVKPATLDGSNGQTNGCVPVFPDYDIEGMQHGSQSERSGNACAGVDS